MQIFPNEISETKNRIVNVLYDDLPEELLDEVNIIVEDQDAIDVLNAVAKGIPSRAAISDTIDGIIARYEKDNKLPEWWYYTKNCETPYECIQQLIKEIKKLTEENKKLKEQLSTKS